MLEHLTAIRFQKVMGSGRTQPCLMMCEDEAGQEREVVVKLRGHPQIMPGGLAAEGVASLLGRDLGLPVQCPLMIWMDQDFVDTVPDAGMRSMMEKSIGWNFGSPKWSPGYTIWPHDQPLSEAMRVAAAEIFVFDGIIQNPDRRDANPNCVFLGDCFLIYDHESAFSGFRDLFPKDPWEDGAVDFLKNHVLFRSLKKSDVYGLERFLRSWESLDESKLSSYIDWVPEEWDSSNVSRRLIVDYLRSCLPHFDDVKNQILSLL